MNSLYWENEPDLEGLRRAYGLMSTNPARAIGELEALADRGSAASMAYLGEAYQTGNCVDRNFSKSEYWYIRASESGSVIASYLLGRIYLEKGEYTKAEKVFQLGQSKGYMPSIHQLGRMHWKALGVPKDLNKARRYFEDAANAGYVFARRDLAFLLMSSKGNLIQFFKGLWFFAVSFIELIHVFITDPTRERLR